jgi:integrase
MHDNKKPEWPHGDTHRLTPHMGSGQWCRKVGGKVRYFGVLSDPDAALRKYLAFMDQQRHGTQPEVPAVVSSDVTLNLAVNAFLTRRMALVEAGEKSARQYVKYQDGCRIALDHFGRDRLVVSLTPADFASLRAKLTGGPVHVGNQIVCIRAMFNWVQKTYGVVARMGDSFNKPGKRVVKAARRERAMWTPGEVRAVLAVASPPLRCFILLGINCAFGQTDCASLTRDSFDLEGHRFPRPKNGNVRMCPFWPATVAALCNYVRPPSSPDLSGLFFVTRFGNKWVQETTKRNAAGIIVRTTYTDSIGQELDKACTAAGVKVRPFYSLRHQFYSVADEAGDPTARDAIMGHTLPGMKEVYTHLLANRMARLRALTNHVHDWLFTV